jgi:hypothetical protein
MAQHTENPAIERLAVFVGEWSMAPDFKNGPPADVGAHVVFEWMPGKRFLIQRWEVPTPEAPDGIAIIGADPESDGNFLQRYFDSRYEVDLIAVRLHLVHRLSRPTLALQHPPPQTRPGRQPRKAPHQESHDRGRQPQYDPLLDRAASLHVLVRN